MQMTSANSLRSVDSICQVICSDLGLLTISIQFPAKSQPLMMSLWGNPLSFFFFKLKNIEVSRKDTYNRQRSLMISICLDCEKE